MSKKKFKEKKSKKGKEQKDSVHKEVLRYLTITQAVLMNFKQIARKIGAKIRHLTRNFYCTWKTRIRWEDKTTATGSFASMFDAEGLTGIDDHCKSPICLYSLQEMKGKRIFMKNKRLAFLLCMAIGVSKLFGNEQAKTRRKVVEVFSAEEIAL